MSKAFDDKVILKDFYYNFSRFEKMGIVGNNGTGKSTFIKMLLGMVAPDSGRFDIGDTVRFGYFSQEGLQFDAQQKVIDVVKDIAEYIDMGGGKHLTSSQFLQYFLFTPEQQHNYVYKLSGGERRKLYLCTVLMKNPNFLVLDEPTNDLDIVTLQILEEYLQDFPGCVIVVSHWCSMAMGRSRTSQATIRSIGHGVHFSREKPSPRVNPRLPMKPDR